MTAEQLSRAAEHLAEFSKSATVDRVALRARELRNDLDAAGVALREQELRERRYLRLSPTPDGMTRITGLLDPESAAIVGAAVDAATSPRRGGPRFIDPVRADEAASVIADERTTDQIALDALIELIDHAVRSDSGKLGGRRSDVRVVVTQADLDRRVGVGHLEGQGAAVSIGTVERLACDVGLVPVLFDKSGRVLNLGRTQRLHTAAQRIAIATRDGGCLMPDCDRPPSWCEVHHITEFSRGGVTSVDDGVLLCRHHHMLMHNNRWRILREHGGYWLIPQSPTDTQVRAIALATKSPVMRRMRATA